jgi:hypothetical protein
MKILVDTDHILEYILDRSDPDNNLLEKVERLWTLIDNNKDIEASITIQGFNKINDILSIFSQENAKKVATRLKSLFKICNNYNSGYVFSPIRQFNNVEKAIELICFYEHGFDALVTEQPERYEELILPSSYVQNLPKKYNEEHGEKRPFIWSIESLINRFNLEKTDTLRIRNDFLNSCVQLSLFSNLEEDFLFKYRIRNRVEPVLSAFNFLKNKGYNGMTKQDFISEFKGSNVTAKSIIWDLQNLRMIETYNNRITVGKHLLDTGNDEISQYLNSILKEHILVKSVYEHLNSGKLLNQWGLDEVIENIYSDKKLKDKTLIDYRSRIISWLIFAKLIERKSYDKRSIIFSLPSANKQRESIIQLQQLELGLGLELEKASNYTSVSV